MIIDIHTHISSRQIPEFANRWHGPFTYKDLLKHMDQDGIDKSVILPLTNPENIDYLGVTGNNETILTCKKHPDRLIQFCNIDPRAMFNTPEADLGHLMKIYKDHGCKGIGEVCANIPIDCDVYQNLFHHAGIEKLPVLFHLACKEGGVYGAVDDLGMPKLEKMLKQFPDTIFIGHAMSFWSEIDGNVTDETRGQYPEGPIKKEGRLWKLLEKYPNLYGDLSAGSGCNAVKRDPAVGRKFLKKFNKQLFFGTDRFFKTKETPEIVGVLKNAKREKALTSAEYENIMHRNYTRVFGK